MISVKWSGAALRDRDIRGRQYGMDDVEYNRFHNEAIRVAKACDGRKIVTTSDVAEALKRILAEPTLLP